MQLEDVADPEVRPGRAIVLLDAAGVNFIDINQRSGAYEVPLPFTPGSEGAGVVEAAGPGSIVNVGDRVAFAHVPGAYANKVDAPSEMLVPIPEGLGTDLAAAVMLQGMTAHYLLNSICDLSEGDWCLLHAAAGGVGLLLIQMAKLKGLRIIGTVSSATKAERAEAAGADHVIDHTTEDFPAVVKEVTGGKGVRAAFDSVGKDTFAGSIDCLAPRGFMVFFGQASGPPEPMDPRKLAPGSLFLTRPTLHDYTSTRVELLQRAGEVLSLVADGRISVHVDDRYALADAPEAHRAMQSRGTTGKLLLIP
jgi:NADPH2:quinone reductase